MQALYENNAVPRSNSVSICGRRSLLKAHAYIMHVKRYNKTFQNAFSCTSSKCAIKLIPNLQSGSLIENKIKYIFRVFPFGKHFIKMNE